MEQVSCLFLKNLLATVQDVRSAKFNILRRMSHKLAPDAGKLIN
ncbi:MULTISPECIES: hypothetical protein [Microcoleaceae]|nr:hypothetical protein [Lyngbya sp. CCAP 1446/10]